MNLSKTQEILIVGGGIIGLSIARQLKRNGVEKVTILERRSGCGTESSSAAAGMLAPQAEADSDNDFFRFCRASRDLYPKFAEELLEESGVDVELDRTGTLYAAFTTEEAEELEKRFVWQRNAGLNVEKLSAKEILEIEPNISEKVLFGLRFPLDWQVENQKIVEALDKIRLRIGAEFISREIRSLIYENHKIIGVETDREKFFAPVVVVASGAWTSLIADKFNLLSGIGVRPVRGQMLAFNDQEKLFRHVIYSRNGYAVPRKRCKILIGATVENAGFENRTNVKGTLSLLKMALEISAKFENLSLEKTWSGLRPFAADGLPVLGAFPEIENLYLATAHYRNGILLAPKTAEIIANEIVGNDDSEYLKSFSPRRFRTAKV